ncbi:hypothetical protein [Coleofasciculus sp. E1-EBD-02]|uniref:hypothetical protein n=1 Tax=Coleofasciculus sp. E1-EBD-02 TaxID=3068481 RepID=UPI0032F97101
MVTKNDERSTEIKALSDTINEIRCALEKDSENDAIQLAKSGFQKALTLEVKSAAAWELSELMIELNLESEGLTLANKQLNLSWDSTDVTRYAGLLVLAGLEDKATQLLYDEAQKDSSRIDIIGNLIELVLSNSNWQIIDKLSITNSDISKLVGEVKRRAYPFIGEHLDVRRYTYSLAKIIVLGGAEDEGDTVQAYWFVQLDEYEAALILRRLLAWLQNEKIELSAVYSGDKMASPFALALAKKLGIEVCHEISSNGRTMRVFSSADTFQSVSKPINDNTLTFSLSVNELPSWQVALLQSPIDIVGIIAPTTLSWSEDSIVFPQLGAISSSYRDTQSEKSCVTLSPESIAESILKEFKELPYDDALGSILEFYKIHKERIRLYSGE